MDYLFVSTAVADELHFPNGEDVVVTLGGAGLYAYAGAKLWTDDVYLACGKGLDFDRFLGPWFQANEVSTKAMFSVGMPTPRTKVIYHEDGERDEVPVYGKNHYEHFVYSIEMLEPLLKDCKGVYLFKEAGVTEFWNKLIELKHRYGFSLMWEISASSAKPACLDQVLDIARSVDILSINRTETKNLFSCDDSECMDRLATLKLPLVYFRQGKQGATLLPDGKISEAVFIPSDESFPSKDPTGAGNSSSGAVLIGFQQGKSLLETGIMGTISAGMCIAQYGPPMIRSEGLRSLARQRLEELTGVKHGK